MDSIEGPSGEALIGFEESCESTDPYDFMYDADSEEDSNDEQTVSNLEKTCTLKSEHSHSSAECHDGNSEVADRFDA